MTGCRASCRIRPSASYSSPAVCSRRRRGRSSTRFPTCTWRSRSRSRPCGRWSTSACAEGEHAPELGCDGTVMADSPDVAELSYRGSTMRPDAAIARVLVVDDNAENRALAKATLDDEDIPVVLAANGEEAIAAFERAPVDCVLLDIRMPGMDGITVCERLRALPEGERVAIVFLTAQRDVDTFDRALRAGGDAFITEPLRPPDLLVRIQTAMRLRRMVSERGLLSVELKQQRDELQRLQLHKEQLTAFLVHDLKNPVHAIELLAQRVLRNPGADERSRDAAAKIQLETRGRMRMLTNVLTIVEDDAGQLAPLRRAIDVGELIRAVTEELQPHAAAAEL